MTTQPNHLVRQSQIRFILRAIARYETAPIGDTSRDADYAAMLDTLTALQAIQQHSQDTPGKAREVDGQQE